MDIIMLQVLNGDQTLKVKVNETTLSVLSRVFSLQPETIYLIGDETVVMPDPTTKQFSAEDILSFIVYEVHGEPIVQKQETHAVVPLGNRFSYQSQASESGSSRRIVHPPPGVSGMNNGSGRKHAHPSRPTFTFHKSASDPSWRKNIVFSEVVDGKLSPIYQIYLSLTTETATVPKVADMVSDEVGTRIMLLDSKGLRTMPSESTKGHSFWLPTRKVYAIPVESAGSLSGKRKLSSSDHQPTRSEVDNVMSELKKMKEDLTKMKDEKESDETTAHPKTGKNISDILGNIFRCNICLGVAKLPAACCNSCEIIIGCISCVEQWREDNLATPDFSCPLCRAEGEYNTVPIIREVQQALEEAANGASEHSAAGSGTGD